jgi:transcriptional/translational regulatory protein YebC/TACO1
MKKTIASLMLMAVLVLGNDKPIDMKPEEKITILQQYTKVVELQRDIVLAKLQIAGQEQRIPQMSKEIEEALAQIKKNLKLDDSYELNDKLQFVKKAKPAKDKN